MQNKQQILLKWVEGRQIARYIINGFVATAVHFALLSFFVSVLRFKWAGLANILAAVFGITSSFIGNRYFVFNERNSKIVKQATKFVILYALIAVLHGFVLFIWTDLMKQKYQIGFIIATGIQVLMSYIGNRIIVFSPSVCISDEQRCNSDIP